MPVNRKEFYLLTIEMLGVFAGLLQLWGYIVYLRIETIKPQPLTWLMFGYGTLVLTVLEWESEATNEELFLPVICTVLGLYVMAKAWRAALVQQSLHRKARSLRERIWPDVFWPEDFLQRLSFSVDLIITVGYIGVWCFATYGVFQVTRIESFSDIFVTKAGWLAIFLILSNLTSFSEFYPLFQETWKNPEHEHPLPWGLWTIAYLMLALVTYHHHGFFTLLMMYPIINAATHGAVALLAMRKPNNAQA